MCFSCAAVSEPHLVDSENEQITQKFYAGDIKLAVSTFITGELDASETFQIEDEQTLGRLALKFVQIHDPVRQIGENIYFACTDFHVAGKARKIYDLDFWLRPGDGELQVYEVKIHKEPRRSLLYGWYKHPRYTFVNDEIVYLY